MESSSATESRDNCGSLSSLQNDRGWKEDHIGGPNYGDSQDLKPKHVSQPCRLSSNPLFSSVCAVVPTTELRYSYKPLSLKRKKIRVLDLQPGRIQDRLSASIRHVKLKKSSYETISYCWGDDALTSHLIIDQTLLCIPDSAYLALKAVRSQEELRTVWIDSVCINQCDDTERGQQIAIMDLIYSHGTRNLIYLGEDDGHADSVVAALEELDEEIRQDTDDYMNFLSLVKPIGPEHHTKWGWKSASPKAAWEVVVRVVSFPWFSRLWVVQEATLARSNVCIYGSHRINLQHLLRVATWMFHQYSSTSWNISDSEGLCRAASLFEIADRDYGKIHHTSVQQRITGRTKLTKSLLFLLSEFAVTDSRDRVYGMLGLWRYCSGRNVPLPIRPDYAKSVAEVLTEAAQLVIRETRRIGPLESVHQGSKKIRRELQMPSWVPLWQSRDLRDDPRSLKPGFCAHDHHDVRLADGYGLRSGSIRLQGFLFATARRCKRACDGLPDWGKLLRSAVVGGDAEPALCDLYSKVAVYTTLLADRCRWNDGENPPATSKDLEDFDAVIEYLRPHGTEEACRNLLSKRGEIDQLRVDDDFADLQRVARSSRNACRHRRFFHLSNGLIGLGPRDMQAGDFAVVLYGGRFPLFLREIEGDKGFYHLVGPAYIHGIMYGEAMREHVESGEADQTFCLK